MKIALLTPTFYEYSGIDKVVELDAKRYTKQGHKVKIFTFDSGRNMDFKDIEVIGMPKNPTLQRIYRLLFFLDFPKINRIAKKLKDFDKIRCYFYPMTWIAKKARKKYGIHYQYWDAGVADPELFGSLGERLYMKLFIYLVNRSVRNADSAVSISKFLSNVLKKQAGLDSKVEYPKIDSKKFHKNVKGARIKKRHGIKNEPVLLFIGRISPHKGVHLLLKSFRLVKKEIQNAKLIIVGEKTFDDYYSKLEEFGGKDVIFARGISTHEIPEYYGACDIYTTATLWEGYDLPIVEANSCGKPVVAFNIGPHPEVLKNGKLVPAKDVKAFAREVVSILKSKK